MAIGLTQAKSQLQQDLFDAFKEAMLATMPDRTELSEAMADKFGEITSEQWANAVELIALNTQVKGDNPNTFTILGQNYIPTPAGIVPGTPVPGVGTISLTGTELKLV